MEVRWRRINLKSGEQGLEGGKLLSVICYGRLVCDYGLCNLCTVTVKKSFDLHVSTALTSFI